MGGVLRMYRGAEMCTVDWDGYLLYGMNSTYEHHPPPQTLIPRFTIPSTETRVTANIPKPNAQYQSICPQIPALVFSNHKPPFTLHTLLQNQEKTGPTPRIRAEPALPCPALPCLLTTHRAAQAQTLCFLDQLLCWMDARTEKRGAGKVGMR